MKPKLTLYSRQDCCLCDEMKAVIGEVARRISLDLEEVDIDGAAGLREKFSDETPVLFINGRKAFKYRVTAKQLTKSLQSKFAKSWFR